MGLSAVSDAIQQIADGGLVIVVDDEQRENEGDLIMAAEKADQRSIAFMIEHTSGIICAPCEGARLDHMALPPMVERNTDPRRTAFTVSADYVGGLTTGVSALERSRTLNALANPDVVADDFVRPGHIFPLRYAPGGVLVRSGHTEAAIDLCRLADLAPAGVLSEMVNKDGTMQRLPELLEFSERHYLPIISIDSLIRYRAENEELVEEVVATPVQLNGHTFCTHVYRTTFDGSSITALVNGPIDSNKPTLVRVIKGVPGREFLNSALTDGNVINRTITMIARAPQGVFIYLTPGSQAEHDEQTGAVWREVGLGSHVLSSLGVNRIQLLASKELTYPGIESFGLSIDTVIKEV